jgi:putative spermidine/putrescine transport system substrate-binding protein
LAPDGVGRALSAARLTVRTRTTGRLAMSLNFVTRRHALIASAAIFAAPYVWSRSARAAAQVVVRNPGGAYSDTQKKYIYEPFTKETGIEVVIVPTTLTKMLAMVKSGNNELDVADAGYDGLVELDKAKALAPIDYAGWKYAKPDDIPEEYKTANTAGMALYATVLGYNKNTFPNNSQPKGWAEFWDAKKFPGARACCRTWPPARPTLNSR